MTLPGIFNPNKYYQNWLEQFSVEKTQENDKTDYSNYKEEILKELPVIENHQQQVKEKSIVINEEHTALRKELAELKKTINDDIETTARALIEEWDNKNSFTAWVNTVAKSASITSNADLKAAYKKYTSAMRSGDDIEAAKDTLKFFWENERDKLRGDEQIFLETMRKKALERIYQSRGQALQECEEKERKKAVHAKVLVDILTSLAPPKKNGSNPDNNINKIKTDAKTNMLISHMPVEFPDGKNGEQYVRLYITLLDDNQLENQKKLVLSDNKKQIILTPRGGSMDNSSDFSLGNLPRSLAWHDRYRVTDQGTITHAPIRSVLVKKSAVFDLFMDYVQLADNGSVHYRVRGEGWKKVSSVDTAIPNQTRVSQLANRDEPVMI